MTQPTRTATPSPFSRGSKSRLTRRDRGRFSGERLFDKIGRAVCEAERLPRKELFEAWEVARRVRRHMRGGRVIDVAAGHGLLGWIMLLLDGSSPEALCIDPKRPPSSRLLADRFVEAWPHLAGRVRYEVRALSTLTLSPDDLLVCVHGCGALTDEVLEASARARARVAVLPCCHDLNDSHTGRFEAWMDGPLAVDVERVHRLRAHGYEVRLGSIPEEITPKNRLILGQPA